MPEGIAEQTEWRDTDLQMFLPNKDFSFPHLLGPCHPQHGVSVLQTWHTPTSFILPTLSQSVPANLCSLCLCASQIPPAHVTQFHLFGPTRRPSSVLDAIEKPHHLLAVRVIGLRCCTGCRTKTGLCPSLSSRSCPQFIPSPPSLPPHPCPLQQVGLHIILSDITIYFGCAF